MYEDYLKNDLLKKKKNYYQKCQALEVGLKCRIDGRDRHITDLQEYKRQENAIAMQAKLLSQGNSPMTTPLEHPTTTSFPFQSQQQAISPPAVTPPLAPMSNPSLAQSPPESNTSMSLSHGSPSKSGGRLRAGSATAGTDRDRDNKTKDVFVDLAQQSKRGFNAFMQKLGGDRDKEKDRDDSGFVMVGSADTDGSGLQRRGTAQGAGMKNAAARAMGAVKTKREAEDAGMSVLLWCSLVELTGKTRAIGRVYSTWNHSGSGERSSINRLCRFVEYLSTLEEHH